MKNDIILYKRIYQLLKNRIECGIFPAGSRLPSRAELRSEFRVSEKTVRRVLEELLEDGLIETHKGTRPIIKAVTPAGCNHEAGMLQGGAAGPTAISTAEPTAISTAEPTAESTAVPTAEPISAPTAVPTNARKDTFDTGRLFCYPVIEHGVALCASEDWEIPAFIVSRMDPSQATEFWRLSHWLWRFFVARSGNDLILRAIDSLGFFDVGPLPGPLKLREAYLTGLQTFIQKARQDGDSKKALLESLSFLYESGRNGKEPLSENALQSSFRYRMMSASPSHLDLCGLEQSLRSVEERYSHVYMDLIGLIAIGRYRPGDKLPSHKELQAIYGVSSDTSARAIRVLREWGIVTARRGSGIYVSMDLAGLKDVKISPNLIGCHLRRFLDSLELLDLTIGKVTEHAAPFIPADKAGELLREMERLWNEEYLYQLTPVVLLEFITEYIQISPLKEIYRVASQNYHIGRCIPKLLTHEKSPDNFAIQRQAAEAVRCLVQGDVRLFSEKAPEVFLQVRKLVIGACQKLGYLEVANQVYDGTALWKRTFDRTI